MHEEPIVRSPSDALTAFRQSHLHYLVLGPLLVWEPGGERVKNESQSDTVRQSVG